MVRTSIEALSIFTVSIVILCAIAIIPQINTHKATGAWWLQSKGYVLMIVGALYIVFGAIIARVGR